MVGCNNKSFCGYITGTIAVVFSLYFLYEGRNNLTILAASAFFLLVCTTDTLSRRIPNFGTLAITLAGLGLHLYEGGASGLLFSFMGLLAGFFLLLAPYLMGGIGAGDVKALAGLGALLGPAAIFQVFIYTGLIGGLLAVFHYALTHNLTEKCLQWLTSLKTFAYTRDMTILKSSGKKQLLRFPYAAAIAFGFYAYVHFGSLL